MMMIHLVNHKYAGSNHNSLTINRRILFTGASVLATLGPIPLGSVVRVIKL